jgi:hypothetical protein
LEAGINEYIECEESDIQHLGLIVAPNSNDVNLVCTLLNLENSATKYYDLFGSALQAAVDAGRLKTVKVLLLQAAAQKDDLSYSPMLHPAVPCCCSRSRKGGHSAVTANPR